MTVYATRNASRDGAINENARIMSFETEADARAWLLAGPMDGLRPRVTAGRFAGNWKTSNPPGALDPTKLDALIAPFSRDEVEIAGPGEHTANTHRITPTAEVLVLVDATA